ncbi:MAG TPA: Fic family protein [Capillimicrobium sp.]|nr:Fic family protein [Capillimicrobium sp.]
MIFRAPELSKATRRDLATLDELRVELGERAKAPVPWMGRLRRSFQAEVASSSIGIEGFHVTPAEALDVVRGGERGPEGDEDRAALACYARAMDHVAAMADDPAFRWSARVILDLHFDACWFQPERRPGRWRTGPVSVTMPGGDGLAYVGPDAADVPALVDELVESLARAGDDHVVVRAAMVHLNLVSIHPFEDGNGRVARIVQSLVLGREGILGADLASIEEHLGRNTGAYYDVLRRVQGGSYQPERDAALWIDFCVGAHLEQARRRLEQLAAAARRWAALEALVERGGWPDRLAVALEQALFGRVDRASYASEAAVSAPTASNDLRRLVDARLLEARGQGRNIHYVASPGLRAAVDRAS